MISYLAHMMSYAAPTVFISDSYDVTIGSHDLLGVSYESLCGAYDIIRDAYG